MEIKQIEPLGFCSGVKRAVNIVKEARLNNRNKDIFIVGKLIHNEKIIENLIKSYKVSFIDGKYKDIIKYFKYFHGNDNEIYILSAHGHDEELIKLLKEKSINYIDATCPFIEKINNNLKSLKTEGRKLVYLGKPNHIECQVTTKILSEHVEKPLIIENILDLPEKCSDKKLLIVNQSTIYIEKKLKEFNSEENDFDIKIVDNFCPALKNRFDQIDKLLNKGYVFLVIGDKSSSNANELYNYIRDARFNPVFFISSYKDIAGVFRKVRVAKIAMVTATSADEDTIFEVIRAIENQDDPQDVDNKLFVNNKYW